MGKEIVFCEKCRREVMYRKEEMKEAAVLLGENYEFTAVRAFCNQCGEEVYVPVLEDARLKALYDLYRQEHDLISPEEVRAISDKYGIGKKALSLLLGWEELTFSRYYDGDLPSKEHSRILRNLLEDHDIHQLLQSERPSI